MKNYIAYCRFSSKKQQDGYSIEAQMLAINEYAQKNKIKILKYYIDDGYSGTTDNRPQFLSMFKDIETQKYQKLNGVIVHKLDRFSRDRIHSLIYKNKLKKRGLFLVSVLEKIEDTPEGIILDAVITAMGEYYSKNLSREVLKGFTIKAKKGEFLGGNIPFGCYIDNNKKMQLKKEYAPIIKDIFLMVYNDFKYKTIIKYINNKTGVLLTKKNINGIIKNNIYLGVYLKKLVNGTILEHRLENKAIDKELYNSVNEKVYNTQKRSRERAKHFLTGSLYCSKCGSLLKYSYNIKDLHTFICKNNHFIVKANKLELIFKNYIIKYLEYETIKKLYFNDYKKRYIKNDFESFYFNFIKKIQVSNNNSTILQYFVYTNLLIAKLITDKDNNNYIVFKFLGDKTQKVKIL